MNDVLTPPAAVGVMCHRFREDGDAAEGLGALTASEFEAILRHVGLDRLLTPEEWLARLAEGRLRAEDRCVTFDDGLRCQWTVARPVLDRLGLRAFWFVYTGPSAGVPVRSEVWAWAAARVGGMPTLITAVLARCTPEARAALDGPEFAAYAAHLRPVAPFYTDDDLRFRYLRNTPAWSGVLAEAVGAALADAGVEEAEVAADLWMSPADWKALCDEGHEVGLHSHSHPFDLAALPVARQREEYATNARLLAAATGRAPRTVAHPLNAYSPETLDVLTDAGVVCGFRANRARVPWTRPHLELPREDAATLIAAVRHDDAVATYPDARTRR